jgi:hypothetical protein
MKTIILTGVSCLLLAGVYGVMNKKSEVSKILSFTQANAAASLLDGKDLDKTSQGLTTDSTQQGSVSRTLNDSHWIDDDAAFQKAAQSDLLTESDTPETTVPQPKAKASETIKKSKPEPGNEQPVTEPRPEIKQLILELDIDTTAPKKKVPVEVV